MNPEGSIPRSRSRFAWFLIILLAICFWDVLIGRNSFYFRDFSLFGYPIAAYLHDQFWAGQLPLWNPYNNNGLPFLAQWNTMALYPGSLFYELLPLPWSVNVFCLAHLVLGGFGMRRLLKRWTGHQMAADIAGVLFVFNGFALNCLMWPNNSAAWGWMPWVVAQLVNLRSSRGDEALITRAFVTRATLVATMQMLTGAPEIILFTWIVGGLLALAIHRLRGVLFVGVVGCLTFLLASPQLLPFLELFFQSQRLSEFATGDWAMPLNGLAHLFVPLANATATPQGPYLQAGQSWTSSFYFGLAPLVFCVFGIRKSLGRSLAVLAIVTLILAHGVVAPTLFRYPIKFVVPAEFCLIALASIGFANLPNRRPPIIATAAMATLVVGAIAAFHRSDVAILANAAVRVAALWLAVVLICRQVSWTPVAVMTVLSLDLLTHMPWQNPTVSAELLKPTGSDSRQAIIPQRSFLTLEAYEELRGKMLADRASDLLVRRGALLQNLNLIDRHGKLDGFFSLYPQREREFRRALYTSDLADVGPILDFLGVYRFSKPGSVTEWQDRTTALPLVTMGQKPIYLREGQILQAILKPDFQPRETVHLHNRAVESLPLLPAISAQAGRIDARATITSWSPQKMEISASNSVPALMVVAQSYDANWRGEVNGQLLKKWRADYNFLAFEIPAGVQTISLRYRSSAFESGLAMAAVAAILGALLLRRRKS